MQIADLLKPERGISETFDAYKVRRSAGNLHVKSSGKGRRVTFLGRVNSINPIYINPEEQTPCHWD